MAEHAGGAEGDWLGGELRRLYRTVASEPVPDQLLALLERLDDRAEEPDADERSRDAGGPDATRSSDDGTDDPS